MQATQRQPPRQIDACRRLDWGLFDRLTAARGAVTIDEKAALVGLHRATLYRLKNGTLAPKLALAGEMADQLGVKVDRLFPATNKAA